MKVEFTAAAERELDEAVLFFETRRLGLGLEFVAEVALAVSRIEEYPQLGKVSPATRAAACYANSNTAWSIVGAMIRPPSTPSCI